MGAMLAFVLTLVAAGVAVAQDLAALSQPVPAPCEAVPAQDTLNGTPGSAPCYTPLDAARPTAIQAANVRTGASGVWAVTFAKPFASPEPIIQPQAVWVGGLPVVCNVTSRSAKAAAGKCWQASVSTVRGVVGTLLNTVVSPFADGAADTPVMIVAREPTQ